MEELNKANSYSAAIYSVLSALIELFKVKRWKGQIRSSFQRQKVDLLSTSKLIQVTNKRNQIQVFQRTTDTTARTPSHSHQIPIKSSLSSSNQSRHRSQQRESVDTMPDLQSQS